MLIGTAFFAGSLCGSHIRYADSGIAPTRCWGIRARFAFRYAFSFQPMGYEDAVET